MRGGAVARVALALASLAAALVATAGSPARSHAQGLGNATIEGVVRDGNGRPVANAAITLVNDQTGQRQLLRASRDGLFRTGFLPPGRYHALFEQFGFNPQRIEDLTVLPGQRVRLPVTLVSAEGAVGVESLRAEVVTALGAESPPQNWITARTASALPLEGAGFGSLALLSTRAGPLLDVEGLPASLSRIVVDGVPVAPRPRAFDSFARTAGFALSAFDLVDLLTVAPDVEWPGSAAGYFTSLTRQGSNRVGGHLFADYGGDALAGAAEGAPFQNVRVGGQFGGPIVADSAHFIVGMELLRSEVPFASLWVPDSETARLIDVLDDNYALDRYTRPTVAGLERASAFGRLDFNVGRNHDVSVRGHVAVLPRVEPILQRTGFLLGPGTAPDARDIFASATVTSLIDEDMHNEVNLGFELSRYAREPDPADPLALELPATTVAVAGRNFGWADRPTYSSKLTGFYIRETVHDRRGDHRLKYGLSAFLPSYDLSFDHGTAGEFTFPGIDDFILRRGAYRRADGVPGQTNLTFRHFTFFAQDTWTPSTDLEVTLGVRYVLSRLPDSTNIRHDALFFALTGLNNRSIARRPGHLEPLVAITWTPGGSRDWVLRSAVIVDGQVISPDVVAEVFNNDGVLDTFAGVGDLGAWPAQPDTFAAGRIGPSLSMLGPKFRGPQTTRLHASLSRTLGSTASLSVSGVFRRTDYLPRRRDLNLLPVPAFFDQHDRRVYGELIKVGGLVAPDPASNRRIIEFDRVWALEATGQSTYTGLTFTLRRPVLGGLALHSAYTYSRAEDDWLLGTGHPESQMSPFPDSLDGVAWEDGRADLDVPHRLVLGAEFKVPGQYGPRIAGLYRFQSGYPFTPGFRDGVDVNGDGSARNDPAFIDPAIPGTAEAIASWACLQDQTGQFARRNSCRGPDQHALDARLSLDVVRTGRYVAQLVVDGLNLLASDAGIMDRALYLIDPAAAIGTNPAPDEITIPYIINPDFGKMRTRFAPQRMIRVGVRVSY